MRLLPTLGSRICRIFARADKKTQIHHVEHEQYLGSLLNANDALVHALMTFEQLDRSIDADSDSDDELAEQAHLYRSMLITSSAFMDGKGEQASLTCKSRTPVTAKKGNETPPGSSSPTSPQPPDLGGLNLNAAAAAPPRPPAATKPNAPPPPKPPRPIQAEPESEPEEDENDPFGDKNVVETPAFERGEPRW